MKKNKRFIHIDSLSSHKPTEYLEPKNNRAKYNMSSITSEVNAHGVIIYTVTFMHDDTVVHKARYVDADKAYEVSKLWVYPEILEEAH